MLEQSNTSVSYDYMFIFEEFRNKPIKNAFTFS